MRFYKGNIRSACTCKCQYLNKYTKLCTFFLHIFQIRCVLIIFYLILKYNGCIKMKFKKTHSENKTDCEILHTDNWPTS